MFSHLPYLFRATLFFKSGSSFKWDGVYPTETALVQDIEKTRADYHRTDETWDFGDYSYDIEEFDNPDFDWDNENRNRRADYINDRD